MATPAAASPTSRFPEPVPLESLRAALIDPLLEEEIQQYEDCYQWDFRASAELVRRLVGDHTLPGMALMAGGEVAGYSYYILEDQKAVIGDLYLREAYATSANERLLMASTLEAIRTQPGVYRVEAQPMMLRFRYSHPRAEHTERLYLSLDLDKLPESKEGPLAAGFLMERWNPKRQDDGAQVIFQAYRGHIDARINDQYGGPGSARRFLDNVVRYPGCGVFDLEASHMLISLAEQRYCGIICGSRIQERVGHITQLCLLPWLRKKGLGRQLLMAALRSFREQGCDTVTLTVTASNTPAVQLYESVGFVEKSRLSAYVWPEWPC